jgi:hypothetical protein
MGCTDGYCGHKDANATQLYGEAIAVGAALVPVWYFISTATTVTRIDFAGKPVLDIFLSGLLFHLVAEEVGLNTWFLTNSHAAKNLIGTTIRGDEFNVVRPSMDWERIGRESCGY